MVLCCVGVQSFHSHSCVVLLIMFSLHFDGYATGVKNKKVKHLITM